MRVLIERNPKIYKGKINSPLPTENITCYMIPGNIGRLTESGRQARMLITLDSISDNLDNAYNDLLTIQEDILQNAEVYASRGFEFRLDNLNDIEDISYIEAVEYLYRYKFDIEVFYLRDVV